MKACLDFIFLSLWMIDINQWRSLNGRVLFFSFFFPVSLGEMREICWRHISLGNLHLVFSLFPQHFSNLFFALGCFYFLQTGHDLIQSWQTCCNICNIEKSYPIFYILICSVTTATVTTASTATMASVPSEPGVTGKCHCFKPTFPHAVAWSLYLSLFV